MGNLSSEGKKKSDEYAVEMMGTTDHEDLRKPGFSPPVIRETAETERIEPKEDPIELGQWYWYIRDDEDDEDWLGCIVHVGSNFVQIESTGWTTARVHFKDIHERLRFEPNAKEVIAQNVAHHKKQVNLLLEKVKQVTARLGVSNRVAIGVDDETEEQTTALATLSGAPNVKDYKTSLVKAKDEELPELFKQIKEQNEELAIWMKADLIPLQAEAGLLKGSIGQIEDRIFNVSLYAGLTEDVSKVKKGEPAEFHEKLHLMQRRLYMDEESLLGYKTGGLEFKNIRQFDKWLSKSDNFNRIFPFPRCMVSMRVRRKDKPRCWGGSLERLFINFDLKELDKLTFLYIRNGEQLWRMNCDLEFETMLFPNQGDFDPNEAMMIRTSWSRVEDIITKREYDDRVEEREREQKLCERWVKDNTLKEFTKNLKKNLEEDERTPSKDRIKWLWNAENPHRYWRGIIDPKAWKPFTPDNVFYDECVKQIADQIKQYNRIALIIQGLFDRSEVLHPHPPVKTWTGEGFKAAVKLVFDADMVLHAGEKPDFEEYRRSCNEEAGPDSVFIGQDGLWVEHEIRKEEKRRQESYRYSYEQCHVYEFYRPYGNKGPGFLAKPSKMTRTGKVSFRWSRERQKGAWVDGEYKEWGSPIAVSGTYELKDLFNVSAYKPGDYLQFFQDTRTRAEYMQWAPALLAAEEYHAGNLKPQEPFE